MSNTGSASTAPCSVTANRAPSSVVIVVLVEGRVGTDTRVRHGITGGGTQAPGHRRAPGPSWPRTSSGLTIGQDLLDRHPQAMH